MCAIFSFSPHPALTAQNVGGIGSDGFGSFGGGGGGGGHKTDANGGGSGRGGGGGDSFRGWDLEPPDSVLGGFSALSGGEGGYHSGVLKHARSAGSLATAAQGDGEALREGLTRRASGIRQQAVTAAAAAAAVAAEEGRDGEGDRQKKQKQRN